MPPSDDSEEIFSISQIESKLTSKEYLCAYHLGKDLKSMLNAFFSFHSKNPEAFLEVFKFSKSFESLYKPCENLVFSESLVSDLNKRIEKLSQTIKEFSSKAPVIKSLKDKKMTSIEKKQLCTSLKKLDPKYLSGVLRIVKGSMNVQGDELEFDVDKLPNKVCRELEKYIKQCLQIKPSKKKNVAEAVKTTGNGPSSVKDEAENRSESSESSSSSSESEDEMPGDQIFPELWDREAQDFANGISIDFDKY